MSKKVNRRIAIHELSGTEIVTKREIECRDNSIRSAKAAYNFMDGIFCFKKLEIEYAYIIALDEKYHPISILESSSGERHSVGLNYLDMAYYTRAVNAKYIIKAHNHPGGNPTPSVADVNCFVGLHNIFREQLLDYVICGSDAIDLPFIPKYYSFEKEEYFCNTNNIYIHHLERVNISLFKSLSEGFEEIEKIKNCVKKLEATAKKLETTANRNGKTQD